MGAIEGGFALGWLTLAMPIYHHKMCQGPADHKANQRCFNKFGPVLVLFRLYLQ
jgi:hypothetical protein